MAEIREGMRVIATIEPMSVEDAAEEYPVLFVGFQAQGLTKQQATDCIAVVNSVCPYCWDGPKGCQCWNDE